MPAGGYFALGKRCLNVDTLVHVVLTAAAAFGYGTHILALLGEVIIALDIRISYTQI